MLESNNELIECFEKKYNKKIIKFNLDEWFEVSQSKNPYLSEEFIREFKDKVDWYWISEYQILSEEFIREFKDKVHWDCISCSQILSEEFIREFKNNVDWYFISRCQKLSCEFIEEFIDKININYLNKNNKINYLKYKLKYGKINNEEYLKELICTQMS